MVKTKYVQWHVKSSTDKRLKQWGGMGDSQDLVINKILDAAEKKPANVAAEPVKPVKPVNTGNLDKTISNVTLTPEPKKKPKIFLSDAAEEAIEKYPYMDVWEEDKEHPGYQVVMDGDTGKKVIARRVAIPRVDD